MFLSRKEQYIIIFPTETENSRRLQAETSDNPIPQDFQTFALTGGMMWFPQV